MVISRAAVTSSVSEASTTAVFKAEFRLCTSSTYRQLSAPAETSASAANTHNVRTLLRAITRSRCNGVSSSDAVPGTAVGRRQVRFGKPHRGGDGYDGGPR
jgi:hypothetical protein